MDHPSAIARLTAAIRTVPDFPKPGIMFKDITPILSDPALFALAVDLFAERHAAHRVDKIAIIDARGFIFGAALAYKMGVGLVPIRRRTSCRSQRTTKSTCWSTGRPRSAFTSTRSAPVNAL